MFNRTLALLGSFLGSVAGRGRGDSDGWLSAPPSLTAPTVDASFGFSNKNYRARAKSPKKPKVHVPSEPVVEEIRLKRTPAQRWANQKRLKDAYLRINAKRLTPQQHMLARAFWVPSPTRLERRGRVAA